MSEGKKEEIKGSTAVAVSAGTGNGEGPATAAARIIAKHETPPTRPTIAELEAMLSQPDGPSIHINPDGSIGAGISDAFIVARAFLDTKEALQDLLPFVKGYLDYVMSLKPAEREKARECVKAYASMPRAKAFVATDAVKNAIAALAKAES